MRIVLIDTDVLSFFFRGHERVVAQFERYTQEFGAINLSMITYYEVLSGLLHKDAHKQLEKFQTFVAASNLLPLSKLAVEKAAELYGTKRKRGTPVDDIDLLIAGIALAHDMGIVTRNTAHFEQLPGVYIENWLES